MAGSMWRRPGLGLCDGFARAARVLSKRPMNVHEALDAWQAQYSGQPPVGFMLRFTHESVWTRIHYLRESPEPATAEDDRVAASRFDAVCSALFTGTTVLVMAIHLDLAGGRARPDRSHRRLLPGHRRRVLPVRRRSGSVRVGFRAALQAGRSVPRLAAQPRIARVAVPAPGGRHGGRARLTAVP